MHAASDLIVWGKRGSPAAKLRVPTVSTPGPLAPTQDGPSLVPSRYPSTADVGQDLRTILRPAATCASPSCYFLGRQRHRVHDGRRSSWSTVDERQHPANLERTPTVA